MNGSRAQFFSFKLALVAIFNRQVEMIIVETRFGHYAKFRLRFPKNRKRDDYDAYTAIYLNYTLEREPDECSY